jgi:FkbM family methyltransferase
LKTIRRAVRKWVDRLWSNPRIHVTKVGGASSWAIRRELLRPGAVVISGGAGRDVSFEIELASRYGCQVFLFDPSPTGVETMARKENQHERLRFLPIGLAARAGAVEFNLPENTVEGSYSRRRDALQTSTTTFSCTTVSEFAREQRLTKIDVLKLDIEGFEYDVLDEVLDAKLPVRQICVEFHHFLPGISVSQTLRCLWRLKRNGFNIVRKEMCDYLFVARSADE